MLESKSASPEADWSDRTRRVDEAISALISLGFTKNNAQLAIQKAIQQKGPEISLEELLKQALRLM